MVINVSVDKPTLRELADFAINFRAKVRSLLHKKPEVLKINISKSTITINGKVLYVKPENMETYLNTSITMSRMLESAINNYGFNADRYRQLKADISELTSDTPYEDKEEEVLETSEEFLNINDITDEDGRIILEYDEE